jgi:hypothetical protein
LAYFVILQDKLRAYFSLVKRLSTLVKLPKSLFY